MVGFILACWINVKEDEWVKLDLINKMRFLVGDFKNVPVHEKEGQYFI